MSDTATLSPPRATLADLMRVKGKAELIGGKVVRQMATGFLPNQVAAEIYVEIRKFVQLYKRGVACTDNVGYAVPRMASGRESFSPDASYYSGPLPKDLMNFIPGPPTFAVEVRSDCDYGPAAEIEMREKRDDYFEAGTIAVWDVDPVAGTIALHLSAERAVLFRAGELAHAEPAMPGWRVAVDELFAK